MLEIENTTYSAVDWLFTMKPARLGLVPGLANITGWVLISVLIVMVFGSLIRRKGYFEASKMRQRCLFFRCLAKN